MAIFVNADTKVVVQGLTGGQGKYHGLRNKAYGTQVVGGVTPGKGGQDVEGIPVFDTVAESVVATGATASFIAVPPKAASAAILEAAAAGIGFIVCITEGIPAQDEAKVFNTLVRDFPTPGCSVRTARASSVRVSATSVSRPERSPNCHLPRDRTSELCRDQGR